MRFCSSLCLVNSCLTVQGRVHTVGSSMVTVIFERIGSGARPALDQMQILARALKIRLRTEIRHVDDERIAFPMAARVAVPLADQGGRCGLPFMTILRCQPWP